ncbi:carboxypeptidase regulatory-like domain-containing protein [Shewanella eurypsychrophilus]|uniref:Carboxypeptidase regulatory-like domain-containing protein n=1 Tax=Shewanella eurypsychrophilus TaxID=2593656 RepID=A0ABX6V5V2_9GAMM|nr:MULTISPECIES: carboxypeptidase regulatory-like domain-containing protein [Shewanella]QFU22649.1 carboxypeptidase regulatory-like domain-containing protein [Shewanella sp. YLB-09]QPG57938.1 carboxypeptidase regulatory-like domain-containing protein [Shewanella eurypsychrophilus]
MKSSYPNKHNEQKQGLLLPVLFLISLLSLVFYLLIVLLPEFLLNGPVTQGKSFKDMNVIKGGSAPTPLTLKHREPSHRILLEHKPNALNAIKDTHTGIFKQLRTANTQVTRTDEETSDQFELTRIQKRFTKPAMQVNPKEFKQHRRIIQGEVITANTSLHDASSLAQVDEVNSGIKDNFDPLALRIAPKVLESPDTCKRLITIPYQTLPVSQELFLISQLKYGNLVISNELFAYQQEGKLYLPIQLLAELLMLPVKLNIDTLSLSGWYLTPDRNIDISSHLMMFWGNSDHCSVQESNIYFDDWDIYIELTIIEQMFGLNINFEPSRQRFNIKESSFIPLSQIQDRRRRYDLFSAQKGQNDQLTVREIKREDAMLGDLAMSVDLGITSQKKEHIEETSVEGFIQARTDFAGHNVYASYSWSETDEVINAYIEKTLSDSWLKHYRIGSIESHSLPLISESSEGKGIRLTAGDGFTQDFRHITIEGEIEPDWDVELYRNNSLIDIQRAGSDARYRFVQVPFFIGLNQYQLRFYGPSGETRTETFSKMLDNSVLEQGQLGFSFGSLQREQDELQLHYVNANWAVTESLTTNLSLVQQEVADNDWLTIPKLGINFIGGEHLIQINYASTSKGYATGVAVQGSKKHIDWLADWEYFDNFNSWENPNETLEQQASLNVNGSIDDSGMSWALSGSWKDYSMSTDLLQFNAALMGRFNLLSYSNELRWQSAIGKDRVYNRMAASGRLGEWYLRSYVDLSISPELEVNQWVVNANSSINDRINYQVEINYQPQAIDAFRVRNSIAYLFDHSSLRLVLDNDSDGDWYAQLKWNSSLLWQPESNLWLLDRVSHLNTGAVKIVAFQDDNANSLFDTDELAISGLSFSGHSQTSASTNQDGELLITHLQTTRPQRLLLKESSLPDPFLIPLMMAVTVNPHPGHVQKVLYPVLYTAELEGSAMLLDGKKQLPAKGMLVTLVSTDDNRKYKTRVEYDGVYIFDRVLPGRYQLSIEDKFTQQINVKPGEYMVLESVSILN